MSWSLQLRFICNERVDFSPPHLHQHLAMLNPGQWWIFKRLASILWERLPYSTRTSFTFQKVDSTAEEERYTSFKAQRHPALWESGGERFKCPFVCVLILALRLNKDNTGSIKSGYLSMHLKQCFLKPQRHGNMLMKCFSTGNLQGCCSHLFETQNCLNPNWWFLNTILGALERVTYGKSIRQLILKTKTWQVHLLINSSVGARIMSATGVLTTINPHFRQGEPYWHIFLIWIFNYSVVPHQIMVKLGTRPERFTQLRRRSRVLCSHEICPS